MKGQSQNYFPSLWTATRGSGGPVQKLITKFFVAFGRHLNIDYVASAPHGAHIAFY
jgi:hypothetical protein